MGRKTLVERATPSSFPSKRKEERPTRKPIGKIGKIKFLWQQELNKLLKGVELKWVSKNQHSKSLLLYHLHVMNAKSMKPLLLIEKRK